MSRLRFRKWRAGGGLGSDQPGTSLDKRPDDADRRQLAEWFKEATPNSAVLFRMLDGKPYDDLIWKTIRPEPTTPDTVWTQEVAA